jgi:cupin
MSSARGLRLGPGVHISSPAPYGQTVLLGDQGPRVTSFVCGFLSCDRRPFNPLLAALPRRIHVRGVSNAWLGGFSRQLTEDSRLGRAGANGVLTRLAELMFIEVLRRYLDGLPPGQSGWLAGVRDEVVGVVAPPWPAGSSLDPRRLGSGGRLVAVQPGPPVCHAHRPAADAVPDSMADAGRGQPPGPERRQGRHHRRGGGIRLRSRVQPGIQESYGTRARRVARRPPHRPLVVTQLGPIETIGPFRWTLAGEASAPVRRSKKSGRQVIGGVRPVRHNGIELPSTRQPSAGADQ